MWVTATSWRLVAPELRLVGACVRMMPQHVQCYAIGAAM
jgi:hypothetical protein